MARIKFLSTQLETEIIADYMLRVNRYELNSGESELAILKDDLVLESNDWTLRGADNLKACASWISRRVKPRMKQADCRALLERFKAQIEAHFREEEDQRKQRGAGSVGSDEEEDHPYVEKPDGIYWRRPTLTGPDEVRLTNFTARVRREITVDDGVETSRRMEVELTRNGVTRTVELSAAQFSSMDWPLTHFGAGAIVMSGHDSIRRVMNAIQLFSLDDYDEEQVYAHMGWREIDGERRYLHARGAIGVGGNHPEVSVSLSSSLAQAELGSVEDEKAAIGALLKILETADLKVTVPLLAAVFCAPLGIRELIVYIHGQTGGGKTTLAELAQQCFGPELYGPRIPTNWQSTANAIRDVLHQGKDALTLIDDYLITGGQGERRRMERLADDVLRSAANQAGRGRADRSGRARVQRPPRGVVISTGEELPAGHA